MRGHQRSDGLLADYCIVMEASTVCNHVDVYMWLLCSIMYLAVYNITLHLQVRPPCKAMVYAIWKQT